MTLIEDQEDFQQMMSEATPKRVIGIPKVENTLQQKRKSDKNTDPLVVPLIETVSTMEEMGMSALNILDNDLD